jgi:hypothetical protein
MWSLNLYLQPETRVYLYIRLRLLNIHKKWNLQTKASLRPIHLSILGRISLGRIIFDLNTFHQRNLNFTSVIPERRPFLADILTQLPHHKTMSSAKASLTQQSDDLEAAAIQDLDPPSPQTPATSVPLHIQQDSPKQAL